MVEIEPGWFVNLRSARKLGLVAKAKRRLTSDNSS
jgi:hypothetical protein